MAEIRKRRLGRTGLLVPELGLGAMDTPNAADGLDTLRAAHAAGITFLDTAREYAGSEFLIGQALAELGSGAFQVGSKTFSRTVHGSQHDIDRSLSALGVDRIDLYQLHDLRTEQAWQQAMGPDGALEGLQVAQYRGLIGHIGVSSHSLELVERAITCGAFATVMLEYSAFYPQSAPLIDLALEHDVGVIVMRPLGGSGRMSAIRGRLLTDTVGLLTPANLLRYVLSHPGVSVAIPGARHPDRIETNAAAVEEYLPMSEAEKRAIEAEAALLYEG